MSLNPLNELKRRLDDDSTPLPKRMCLAKNVVQSLHFPAASKERVVAEWLEQLMHRNLLKTEELRDLIGWLNLVDDLTSQLKSRLIQIVTQYLEKNPLQEEDIQYIVAFLENPKISTQLAIQIDDYLLIIITLLQNFNNGESDNKMQLSQKILNNLIKYYKESKKKLEFLIKFLKGENIETVFSYLDTECHDEVVNVCQNILFPMNKKSFFVSFLQTLIRKDDIDELIAEKGDNIQSVLKIMSAFFTFPNDRTEKDQKFLADFINMFVTCYKTESQLIFAFYIMVVNSLNMNQSYLSPAMKMPAIIFEENDEKIKRGLFFNMLEALMRNEVDITVRLTDTFGEKISKVEIKKNFTSFLQTVMMGQLKLEGKLDKTTLEIIKTALKLDPLLIEQKMDIILPPLMIAKKNSTSISQSYAEMLNSLIEILFKLSRGTIFVNQILPHVKLSLEACNTEQFELKQKIKQSTDNGVDCEKLKSKIVTGNDVFPQECVEVYGKWTSELMFRQNKELLVSLQKDFEENCLMMLEEGFVSPSIITLAEVLSAILSAFLRYNKMADHTVPQNIAEDFWGAYQSFEKECLGKFGECILKLNYNPTLSLSFLRLCQNVAQLKLLNLKYSNTKLDVSLASHSLEVYDLSVLLPCLSGQQWIALVDRVCEDDATLALNNLLLLKTMAINILSANNPNNEQIQEIQSIKTILIKQLSTNSYILTNSTHFSKVLFANLEKSQLRVLAKSLVKVYLNENDLEMFKMDAIRNNKPLLNAIVLEVAKNISKCFENAEDLSKGLSKADFDFISFVKTIDTQNYFNHISVKENQQETILNCIELLRHIPIPFLEEPYQLIVIFNLLISKKCCHSKKVRKGVDYVMQSLYDLSPKYPDLYKIFPVSYIFSFEDKTILDLLILKIKTSNNMLVIKCVLESAVKKVKTDSEVVKTLVEILLSKQPNKKDDVSSIEYFSDVVFQISCIILPLIAKEKKAITTSAYRSILANLQEKLHKSMLESFKNIDFSANSSLLNDTPGNIEDSLVISESTVATLNAMGAYSLTLSKYCETTDAGEIKNLDCLWSGLEFFLQNAIHSIQNPATKLQHVDSSIQLLNVTLRHIKKLDSHPMFENKDQIYVQIWKSVKSRLLIVCDRDSDKRWRDGCLEDMAVTLKFICELTSVECFVANFVSDLSNLAEMKAPSQICKTDNGPSTLTSHIVSKYLWTQCLKANIAGPKCTALAKLMHKTCKALRFWVQQHYEANVEARNERRVKNDEFDERDEVVVRVVKVDDVVCELLRVDLDMITEAVFAAKKMSPDYKFLDAIFELQHVIHRLLGHAPYAQCEVSWQTFFKLFEGCVSVLNALLVAREELLEDRWPCYMQCYRALVAVLCFRSSSSVQLQRHVEDKLGEIAHSVEKLTQSICKRKTHVSRIAAYSVADICSLLERTAPARMVRLHLENAVALLVQASDSSYAVAFLRRALAGSAGQMTMTNLYTMYKRYHKYVGNA